MKGYILNSNAANSIRGHIRLLNEMVKPLDNSLYENLFIVYKRLFI